MKIIFKTILKYYLGLFTKLAVIIHNPNIIAVAGSTNKSFVKDEIKNIILSNNLTVRANPKNFNTEIGLPLAILNLPSGYNEYIKWFPALVYAPINIFKKFPKYLVLELGVSDEGDMRYLLKLIKPKITIITDISQRYLEGFDDMDELVGEYERLIKETRKDGLIILNNDNYRVKGLKKLVSQKLITFSLKNKSDWQAVEINKIEDGQEIKIMQNGIINKCSINKFGKHNVQAYLIGLIISNYFKI